jgi:pimeloyl-ACP methyl ester carboxylesterase
MSRHLRTSEHRLLRGLLAATVALGASAYVTRRMTRRAIEQSPPQGKFVEADGVRLHYTESGDPSRPAVILVHGNGAMGREMEISGLAERLASRYHVVVFDRPGYGHSERPTGRGYTPELQADILLAAVKALGIERPVVLGHSWGAMVALAMALAEPHRLRALVLVAGYYTATPRLDTLWLGAPAIPVLGTLMRHTVSPLLGRLLWPLMVKRIFAPARVTERFDREYPVGMSLRPGQLLASAAEAAMMPMQALRLRRRENELQVPTMIVAGDKDRLVMTSWQSQRLHDRLPQTCLRVVPGEGHMVHHTATERVVEAVDEAWHMSSPSAVHPAVPETTEHAGRPASLQPRSASPLSEEPVVPA